jgi:putative tricarboxylic transport membrane protein
MGAGSAAVGAVTVALAWGLREGTATGGPSSRFLPVLLGGLMIILGAIVALGPAGARPSGAAPAGGEPGAEGHGRALATVALMGVYALLLDRLGFLLTTTALLAVLVRMYGERRWLVALGVSVCATGAAYGLFAGWLKVPLPPGLLAP